MRLNPDCVRDLLLTVEDTTTISKSMDYYIDQNNFPRLISYSHEEILYHIRQCKMDELITNAHFYDAGDLVIIPDLSPKGHEFLANIRSDNAWNKTKTIAEKTGSYSLNALTTIATGVITQIINQHLGVS